MASAAVAATAWLTGGLCLLSGTLAYVLVGSNLAPAIFWPPAGIALAAVLLWGVAMAPAALLGSGLAVLLHGQAWASAGLIGLAVAVQALVGSLLLRRIGFSKTLELDDLFRLALLGGLLAGALAAPATWLALHSEDWFWEAHWLQAALAAVSAHLAAGLVFAPVLLCWRQGGCLGYPARRLEMGLALGGLALTSLLLAHPALFGLPESVFRPYPLLPFLLWLALRADIRSAALGLVWFYAVLASTLGWGQGNLSALLSDVFLLPIHGLVIVIALSILLLAVLMASRTRVEAALRASIEARELAEQARFEQAIAHKDALIREVHHRIKNNLQTVVGLLRREAGRHPEAKASIETAITQVQSVAVVHGLHGRVNPHSIMLCELLPAIVGCVSDLSGMAFRREGLPEGAGELRIKESETVAVALILNELATNAVKHSNCDADRDARPPQVSLVKDGRAGLIVITNSGRLPPDFDFDSGRGLGAGLGLVRALAPSPGVRIRYRQADDRVEVSVRIEAPCLQSTHNAELPMQL